MIRTILNLGYSRTIWSGEAETVRDAVHQAIAAKADLSGADLSGATRLPTTETWDEYLTQVLPALLTAGGHALESFTAAWACHSWDNCPMAHAFNGHSIQDVPILLRPRAEQFVQLFDAKLIPWPLPEAKKLRTRSVSVFRGDLVVVEK